MHGVPEILLASVSRRPYDISVGVMNPVPE